MKMEEVRNALLMLLGLFALGMLVLLCGLAVLD